MTARLPPAGVLILALAIPLMAAVPSLQGYLSAAPPDRIFLGFRYMAGDHYQYAAFVREARDHASLLMENPFTGEPQKGVFVLPYFWALGLSARWTGASIPTIWEVARIVGGSFYILAFWWFSGTWLESRSRRAMATAIFGAGGGINWIVALLLRWMPPEAGGLSYPYDYFWNWSTAGTMVVPNWVWPAAALLLAVHAATRPLPAKGAIAFVLLPIVWFLHPYSGMVGYLAFGLAPAVAGLRGALKRNGTAHGAFADRTRLVLPGLLSFAFVAAYLLWARTDEVFRLNSAMGFTWTDSFALWWYPLSYGLLLPLAWYGLRRLAAEASPRADLLLGWLAAAFLLSVNPWYAGVKFQYLLYPPLAVLASLGLFHLLDSRRGFRRLSKRPAWVILFCLILFGNAPLAVVKDWRAAAVDPNIHLSEAELDAMAWLDGEPDGLVLTTYGSGNRIPWLAGKKVVMGHWFLTPHLEEKLNDVTLVFTPQASREARREVLRRTGARYIYARPGVPVNHLIDPEFPVALIYNAGGVRIFRVGPQDAPR